MPSLTPRSKRGYDRATFNRNLMDRLPACQRITMASPFTTAIRTARISCLWACLLTAMVLAQTLGFVHGSTHVHLRPAVHPPSAVTPVATASTVAAGLKQLFNDHDDAAQCRLYDQVSRGECAPTAELAGLAAMPLATAPVETTIPWHCGICLPARARGPPLAV